MTEWVAYPGSPYPLGATWDGSGVNFALFSEHAERVELCIFDQPYGATETARVPVTEQTDFIWHVYLPMARPGLIYGYRVYGPYTPSAGHRFNPNKLLLDPYAKAITGPVQWSDAMYGFVPGSDQGLDPQMSTADSAPGMPKAVVVEPGFSWGDDRPLRTGWSDTVIYEAHVRGLTMLNPAVPENIRGTYAALSHRSVIQYLLDLGITAIELMPVHHFVDDRHLVDQGLRNYWGYNSIGYFAPETRYASSKSPGQAVDEFKTMVRTLHQAGIEVILDVVYNHTAEGNHVGPTLSFRGVDNLAYYRPLPGDLRFYLDYTGTGNTLNMQHPRSIQLIMDSLRYWILDMHVDGFRFDLAAALARELHEVDRLSAFFDIIQQDPVISQAKLIAEPWDLGEGGYQVGNFPVLWTEWNGKYRDCVRRYWRGDPGQVAELAYRLTGSSDLYAHNGRKPHASINFVTAHDGFTLRDLVSYNQKHNEANGEGNRDGAGDNISYNYGVEGETPDPATRALRARAMRNFLTTLCVSQGVPMLLHGDEVGRTQQGNNNPYSQDGPLTWQPWDLDGEASEMLAWTQRIIAFRKSNAILRRRRYFQGREIVGAGQKDIAWLKPDGTEMDDPDWANPEVHALAVWLAGAAADVVNERGEAIIGDTLLILMNSSDEHVQFKLPPTPGGRRWSVALDTFFPALPDGRNRYRAGGSYQLQPRSMAVLKHPAGNNR